MENTVIGTDLEINVGKNYKGKLGVSGKSEQATRSGKNKFDISKATKASGPCSFKNNGDSIDITATEIGGYISANIDITDLFKEGETIYAKANFVASSSNTGAYRIQWGKDSGLAKGDIVLASSTSDSVKSGVVPTKPEGATKLLLYLYGNVEGTVAIGDTVTYSKIMLSNQPITDYEEYGAMPSPEFPSEIKSVGDKGTVTIEQRGKNLFDKSKSYDYTNVPNKITSTQIDTGVRIQCSKNGESPYVLYRLADLKNYVGKIIRTKSKIINSSINKGRYLLALNNSDSSVRITKVYTDISEKEISFVVPSIEEMGDNHYLAIYLYTNSTGTMVANDYVDYIDLIVTIDNEDMSYEPYFSKDYVIPLSAPLRSLPNGTKDTIEEDGIHRRVGRVVLDGSENWGNINSYAVFYLRISNILKSTSVSAMPFVLSNYYTPKSYGSMYNRDVDYGVGSHPTNNYLIIRNKDCDDVNEFKQWLSTHNTEVLYELSEEVVEPFTEEQQEVWNEIQNIYLYDGITHIFSTDEIEPNLEFTYYKIVEDFDAFISSDGYFNVPKYDIKYLIDFNQSNIPDMPEASEASVKIAGRDGDIPLITTYEPIPFEIVCYTEDNLTPEEKVIEEDKVNKFLNSIKNNTKTFARENKEKFYNIKYNGLLTTTVYPKHIQFSIPLKSSESYAKEWKEYYIKGNNKKDSNTIKPVGAIFTIIGPAQKPIISLNDYQMEYNGVLLENQKLIIDSNKSTVIHVNSLGVKTNVMKYYNHQFPKIENGTNELKILSGIYDDARVIVKWYDLKL